MWFKFISYVKFLLKSTNAHGVHSPFVYKYVTECLYSKSKLDGNKSLNALLKSIDFFNAKQVYLESNQAIQEQVKRLFPEMRFDGATHDILFMDRLDTAKLDELLSLRKLHNDSMILIDSIHKNSEMEEEWRHLITSKEITVSIDMYHCGAIFIRKEQVKQHFTIRI